MNEIYRFYQVNKNILFEVSFADFLFLQNFLMPGVTFYKIYYKSEYVHTYCASILKPDTKQSDQYKQMQFVSVQSYFSLIFYLHYTDLF